MLGLVPPPSFRARRDLRPRFAQLVRPRFTMKCRIFSLGPLGGLATPSHIAAASPWEHIMQPLR